MTSIPFLSQRNPVWSAHKLGPSNETIGAAGCLFMCGVMAHGIEPGAFTHALLRVGAFRGAYLVRPYWQGLNQGRHVLRDIGAAGEYRLAPFPEKELAHVKAHILAGGLALIEVNAAKWRRGRSLESAVFVDAETREWAETIGRVKRSPAPYSQHFVLAQAVAHDALWVVDPWDGAIVPLKQRYGSAEKYAICRALTLATPA